MHAHGGMSPFGFAQGEGFNQVGGLVAQLLKVGLSCPASTDRLDTVVRGGYVAALARHRVPPPGWNSPPVWEIFNPKFHPSEIVVSDRWVEDDAA